MGHAKRATTMTQVNRDQLETVQGVIAFGRRSPDEAAPAVEVPTYDQVPMVSYDIPIRDARPIAHELSLDREGFELIRQKSSCEGLHDPEVVREKYMDEMVPFIKDYFNASWVVPRRSGTYMRRSAGTALPKNGWNSSELLREPGGLAHIDYPPIAGPMIAAAENQVQGIPIRPYSRMMIIQAWRALSPPPQDFPLAFCDASTLAPSDISVVEYVSNLRNEANSVSKTTVIHRDEKQRWYYFPDMLPDELILFKGYDSDTHYAPRAAHSAFDNRRAQPGAHPRESIEGRFFVYFA
jgi:hypothetical protein